MKKLHKSPTILFLIKSLLLPLVYIYIHIDMIEMYIPLGTCEQQPGLLFWDQDNTFAFNRDGVEISLNVTFSQMPFGFHSPAMLPPPWTPLWSAAVAYSPCRRRAGYSAGTLLVFRRHGYFTAFAHPEPRYVAAFSYWDVNVVHDEVATAWFDWSHIWGWIDRHDTAFSRGDLWPTQMLNRLSCNTQFDNEKSGCWNIGHRLNCLN